jgi:uncharacterized protein YndB with AHSA1/START domain
MANIIHRVGIKAAAARVFAALSTIDGLSGWWTKGTSGKSEEGGTIEFRFTLPEGRILGTFEMHVLKLIPDELVLWRCISGPPDWINTEIAFNLSTEEPYTIVMFNHDKWQEQSASMAHCTTKWATFLLSLKSLVETGKGRPAPDDEKIDNWN